MTRDEIERQVATAKMGVERYPDDSGWRMIWPESLHEEINAVDVDTDLSTLRAWEGFRDREAARIHSALETLPPGVWKWQAYTTHSNTGGISTEHYALRNPALRTASPGSITWTPKFDTIESIGITREQREAFEVLFAHSPPDDDGVRHGLLDGPYAKGEE